MDYSKKYLKYKNKYIGLKNSFIQKAGVNDIIANLPPREQYSQQDQRRQGMLLASGTHNLVLDSYTPERIRDIDDAINLSIYLMQNGQLPRNSPTFDMNDRNLLRRQALASVGMQNVQLETIPQQQLNIIDERINRGIEMLQRQQQQVFV